MNSFASSRRVGAFTLVELLTVIAIIGILAALLLPVLGRGKLSAKRAWCESNLQQIGIAFHAFANDHNGKFPMAVSTNDVGSMEFVQAGFTGGEMFYTSFRHFQSLSGELGRPEILICPTDTRLPAANFPALQNSNVSYFVGVDADAGKSYSILAGDRNLVTNSLQSPTILQMGAGSWLRWTRELHQFKGNILFADGHVEEWNNSALASAENGLPASASLFLPSVGPGANTPSTGVASSGPNPVSGAGMASTAPAAGGPGGHSPAASSGSSVISGGISGANSAGGPAMSSIAGARAMAQSANSQSNRPPGASYSSNTRFDGTRTAAAGVENSSTANRTVPAAPVAPVAATAASDNAGSTMSPSEQRLAGFLQGLVEDGYLLLLLLLLLYLAYKWWRRMQRRARLKRAAQESTLDSGPTFR